MQLEPKAVLPDSSNTLRSCKCITCRWWLWTWWKKLALLFSLSLCGIGAYMVWYAFEAPLTPSEAEEILSAWPFQIDLAYRELAQQDMLGGSLSVIPSAIGEGQVVELISRKSLDVTWKSPDSKIGDVAYVFAVTSQTPTQHWFGGYFRHYYLFVKADREFIGWAKGREP